MSLVPWSVRRVILLVIFSLGLIGGALLLWAAFAFSVGVKPCVELSQSELRVPDTDCVYHVKDMIVVDQYAEFGNDVQTDDRYYLIWFEDGTGTPYCASLEVDSKADISLQCKEYAESEETLVGELVLDGYFTCASMERGHAMDEWYFGNVYEQYKENLTGEPLEYHFRYEAAEYEDYVKEARILQIVFVAVAAAMVIGFGLGIFFILKGKKKPGAIPGSSGAEAEQPENVVSG